MIGFALLCLGLQPDPHILIQKGELPVVISAPHGGREAIPNCPLRVNKSAPQFVTVLDTNSDKLAILIAESVEKQTGKKPWLVVAKFSRKYVDANRPEEHGTESEAGREVYRRYHAALREAVDWCRALPTRSLLLDVHAQGQDKEVIFRGTANLSSLKDKDLAPFAAENGFLKGLESAGIKVVPTVSQPTEKENPSFNGGWITRHYGASQKDGIDAIQLETGSAYRSKEAIQNTAEKIASAIKSHIEKPKN